MWSTAAMTTRVVPWEKNTHLARKKCLRMRNNAAFPCGAFPNTRIGQKTGFPRGIESIEKVLNLTKIYIRH